MKCCDLHNVHCEPPSELCCEDCVEMYHPTHRLGTRCVLSQGRQHRLVLRCGQDWCQDNGREWTVVEEETQPGLIAAPTDYRCSTCGCAPAPLSSVWEDIPDAAVAQ